ncbi:MAG: hypothetical protein J1E02_07710 [Coprobacter sp.]|nr:hypothetical protein [Coprobacter sp.]
MKSDDKFRAFFAGQAQPLRPTAWFARRVANRLPQPEKSCAKRIETVSWCLAWLVGLLVDGWLVCSLVPLPGCGAWLSLPVVAAGITALSVWAVLIYQLVRMLRI